MKSSPKTVLVTGASGMLGRVLVRRLEKDYRVLALSKSGAHGTVACDLSLDAGISSVWQSKKPDLVIHSAAYSDVDGCEKDPQTARAANALSTQNLARLCEKEKTPFIYVSTDYVFDGLKKTPYTESDPTGPVNIYGLTKLEGEYHALSAKAPSAVVRTSWLFGPDNPKTFTSAIIDRLKKEKKVSVLDNQVDNPTSVADLSEALLRIAQWLEETDKKAPVKEIFHFCNAGSTTRYDMTVAIRDYLRLHDHLVERMDLSKMQDRPAIRPAYVSMSTAKYEKFFSTRIRHWNESLSEYLGELR